MQEIQVDDMPEDFARIFIEGAIEQAPSMMNFLQVAISKAKEDVKDGLEFSINWLPKLEEMLRDCKIIFSRCEKLKFMTFNVDFASEVIEMLKKITIQNIYINLMNKGAACPENVTCEVRFAKFD